MENKIKGILKNQLGCKDEDLKDEANLVEDLGADSLTVMQIVLDLEDEFGMEVDDSELNGLRTVKDIIDYCHTKLGK